MQSKGHCGAALSFSSFRVIFQDLTPIEMDLMLNLLAQTAEAWDTVETNAEILSPGFNNG